MPCLPRENLTNLVVSVPIPIYCGQKCVCVCVCARPCVCLYVGWSDLQGKGSSSATMLNYRKFCLEMGQDRTLGRLKQKVWPSITNCAVWLFSRCIDIETTEPPKLSKLAIFLTTLHAVCDLSSRPGIEHIPFELEAWSLNQRTTREDF